MNSMDYKNAMVVAQASKLRRVISGRTETLMVGRSRVVAVVPCDDPLSEDGLVWLVASAAQLVEHPLAQAVVDYAQGRGMKLAEPASFETFPGNGLRAAIDGRTVFVGDRTFMENNRIALDSFEQQAASLEGAGRTTIFAAVDGKVAGIIAIADAIGPSAR